MEQASYQYPASWDLETKADHLQKTKVSRKVVKSKANSWRKKFGKIGVFVFLYALLLVFLCAKGSAIGYEINQLEKDVSNLETINKRLEYQIAQAASLDKVQEIAQFQLHMYRPDGNNTLPVASINYETAGEKFTVASASTQNEGSSESTLSKLYNSLVQLADNNL